MEQIRFPLFYTLRILVFCVVGIVARNAHVCLYTLRLLTPRRLAEFPNCSSLFVPISKIYSYSVYLGCFIFLMIFSAGAFTADKPPTPDVRILIDVSGSMKRTDPNNLRIPATRLLINLLPPNSLAGIWIFGTDVTESIPHGIVDQNWRAIANQFVTEINSNSLFTNIGKALTTVSQDWGAPDPHSKRCIIILSDGLEDISKNPEVNQSERQKIFDKIMPSLKASHTKIYSIALSTEADKELLKALAIQTDGLFESIQTADELPHVFFKFFEASVPRNALPVQDGSFIVDSDTLEFTTLIFHSNSEQGIQFQLPNSKIIDKDTKTDNMNWHHEDSYDLITVDKPDLGKWFLITKQDPSNRVFIVSNLTLHTQSLPGHVYAYEPISYIASILRDEITVDNQDFLNILKVTLAIQKQGSEAPQSISELTPDKNGLYHQTFLFGPEQIGLHDLIVTATSKTFARSTRNTIAVIPNPVSLDLTKEPNGNPLLKASIDLKELNPSYISLLTNVTTPKGEVIHPLFESLQSDNALWGLRLPNLPLEDSYIVSVTVQGKNTVDRKFQFTLPAIVIKGSMPPPPKTPETPKNSTDASEQSHNEMISPSKRSSVSVIKVIGIASGVMLGLSLFILLNYLVIHIYHQMTLDDIKRKLKK